MSRAEAAFIVWGFFLHILQKHYLVSPGPWRLPQSREICLGPEPQATSFSSCSLTALRPESRESWWMEVLYVWFEVLFFSLFPFPPLEKKKKKAKNFVELQTSELPSGKEGRGGKLQPPPASHPLSPESRLTRLVSRSNQT